MSPKPPLAPRQRLGAQLAGGLTFLFIGGSVIALILTVMSVSVTLLFVGTWQLAVGADEEFVETTDVLIMRGAVTGGWCLLACAFGYGASLLTLRIGKVSKPNLTTLLGSGIAVVSWSIIAGSFVAAYFWAGHARWPWTGSSDASSQFLTVLIIGMAIISGVVVGALSWWLAAHVLRPSDVEARTS